MAAKTVMVGTRFTERERDRIEALIEASGRTSGKRKMSVGRWVEEAAREKLANIESDDRASQIIGQRDRLILEQIAALMRSQQPAAAFPEELGQALAALLKSQAHTQKLVQQLADLFAEDGDEMPAVPGAQATRPSSLPGGSALDQITKANRR